MLQLHINFQETLSENRHTGEREYFFTSHRSALKSCRLIPGPSQSQRWLSCSSGWKHAGVKLVLLAFCLSPLPSSLDSSQQELPYTHFGNGAQPFPTCCISELCCPPVASTLLSRPSSAAWVSPLHCCPWPLGCGGAFPSFPCSHYLPIWMPSFLKTSFCHVASRESNPYTYQFQRKARKKEVVIS